MTLEDLKKILQLTNAMRSALRREVNDLAVRPDYALIQGALVLELEVWAMERVKPS